MSVFDAVKGYFNLRAKPTANAQALALKKTYVVPQYIALVVGIITQPFLDAYIQNGSWPAVAGVLPGRIIFGLIAGLAIFPGVYKNAWDNKSPLLVQLCSIFSAGLGWQTLIAAGSHLAHPAA